MKDEAAQSVPPEKFLSAAERYQLAPAIDRWVVRKVIETLLPCASELGRLAGVLRREYFRPVPRRPGVRGVHRRRRCASSGLPLSMLSLEVTETAAVANIVRAESLIRRLRDLGCDVALDDFGRGLSSLTYLKTLPVTHLKIDGTLRARRRRRRALEGDAERHRAARPRDGAARQSRNAWRAKRSASPHRRAGRRIRPGFLARPAAAAGGGAGGTR